MDKRSSLKQINHHYHKAMKSLIKGSHEKDIFDSLSNGKNTYLRLDRLESSSFDSRWIEVIEDVIFDLGDIIANPRMNTKTEGHIVPVELARKTGAESVQHLASHTQYVKEIDDYGNVIPSKILTMAHEDDIRTYENRFIATFVRRLVLFVEKRYEIVSQFAELHDEEVLMFKNKSFVDGANVEIETKIKINHKSDDELSLKSNAYVKRIEEMRRYILYFYNSDFMKQLKTERDVHNPILQTNIIRKNPKYHHCYEVYRFIERYEHLGVAYRVDENYSLFNDDELAELNRTIFANYITLRGKDRSKNAKVDSRVYKPKILTSIDDESFIYGPLLSGPISFVRVDEQYQQYLDSKIKKDLPLHPTKKEKEYYADEYEEKRQLKEDQKQKENLVKRVEKGVKAFEKSASKIDEEREQARLALLEQEKQVIKKEEDDMLEAARNELIAASLKDQEKEQKERDKQEKEFLASIKPAEVPVKMSHPKSKPVTYEQAVEQIWPFLKEQPVKKSKPAPVEKAPIKEETPIVEQPVEQTPVEEVVQPAALPTPMSHPASKPVSYDEAVLDIWPVLGKKPAKKAAPKKANKAEPQPVVVEGKPEVVKEEPKQAVPVKEKKPLKKKEEEIKPAVVPTPMSHPHSDPVSYDEAVVQIWPQLLNKPEPPKEEKVKEETPKAKKAPVKKAAPKKEEKKPEPKKEPKKAEPKKESQAKEAPKKVVDKPAPIKKAAPAKKAEEKKEPVKKETPAKKEKVKPAPKKEEKPVVKPEPKEKPKAQPKKAEKAPEREKIPGRFIVKTNEGYYISKNKFSIMKEDAKIFDDFNAANDIKKELGGKVVKL